METDETRTCTYCKRTLPVSAFYSTTHKYQCKECLGARNKIWQENNKERRNEKKREYRRKTSGKSHIVRPSPTYASPGPDLPIPHLDIGKEYEITDRLRNGRDDESYIGPCVGRWGRNWGIKTSTGIRCFTPGQLVGLQIKEVERIA